MHFISEQFTAKYGHHSGFQLITGHQPHRSKQSTNLLQHKKLQEIKANCRTSPDMDATLVTPSLFRTYVYKYFSWFNVTNLKIQCQPEGTRTYYVQLFFSIYVIAIICTIKFFEFVYERINCFLQCPL